MKELNINSAKECMEIIESIVKNEYDQETRSYACYKTMNYFANNISKFNKKDFKIIEENSDLFNKISNKLIMTILGKAIENNQELKFYSNSWFKSVKSNAVILTDYLNLLLKSDDLKQIEDFCESNHKVSKNLYEGLYSTLLNCEQSYTFEKSVVLANKTIANVIESIFLKEKDFVNFFEENLLNYEHLHIKMRSFSHESQMVIAREKIEQIVDYGHSVLNVQNKIREIVDLIADNPVFFLG